MVALGFGDAVLPNLIEQRFVADLQKRRGLLAIPVRLFERLPDGFSFGFVLSIASQRFQAAGFPVRRSRIDARAPAAVAVVPGLQFGRRQLLVTQDQVALQEVIAPANCPATNAPGRLPAAVAKVGVEAAHIVRPCAS